MLRDAGYRVMVVEDEALILDHLVSKIEALPLPLVVSATATNGEDAFRLIEQAPPDIVFTDIRMPLMNGLELSQRIHERYPSVAVVIISGYNEFEYARQALRYNVSDYLLKPINPEKLLSIASKLCGELSRKRRQTLREIFDSALNGSVTKAESDAAGAFYVSLIKVGNVYAGQAEALVRDSMSALWKTAALSTRLSDIFGGDDGWWLMDTEAFSFHLLITEKPDPDSTDAMFDYLRRIPSGFCINVCEYPGVVTAVELRTIVRLLSGDVTYRLIPCRSRRWRYEANVPRAATGIPQSVLNDLLPLFRTGHVDVLEKYLRNLFLRWQGEELPQVVLTRYLYDLLEYLTEHNACRTGKAKITAVVLPVFARSRSEQQLYDQLSALVQEWVLCALSESHSSVELYRRMKKYIDENYRKPLTVESLSDVFHFSPSYISRIFRKYEKQPPIQYLIQVRMRKAGEMIRANPDVDIKTVAELVGYANQHYFSRYFKQYFSVAPSDYQKGAERRRLNP